MQAQIPIEELDTQGLKAALQVLREMNGGADAALRVEKELARRNAVEHERNRPNRVVGEILIQYAAHAGNVNSFHPKPRAVQAIADQLTSILSKEGYWVASEPPSPALHQKAVQDFMTAFSAAADQPVEEQIRRGVTAVINRVLSGDLAQQN